MENNASKLIEILTAHKNDAEAFFDFFHQNERAISTIFDAISNGTEGIAAVLDSGKTPQGREKLLAMLPDKASQDAMEFLLAHPTEIKAMSEFAYQHGVLVDNTLNVLEQSPKELAEITKFAAEHPKEIQKCLDIEEKSKGSTEAEMHAILNDRSLMYFIATHPLKVNLIKKFAAEHTINGLDELNAKDISVLQSGLQFLVQYEKQLPALSVGIPAVLKKFAPVIEVKQKAAEFANRQQEENEKKLAQFKQIQGRLNTDWEQFAKGCPALYEEAVKLQKMEIQIVVDYKNPITRSHVSTEAQTLDKAMEAFDAKVNAAHYQGSNPVITSGDFFTDGKAPLVEKAMAYGRQAIKKETLAR